jgi:hypothetical protein
VGTYCAKPIESRSKFAALAKHRCFKSAGHDGKCDEYPYLEHLEKVAPKVAMKIKRDSTNTTGAAWASDDAGPNRILRWAMLLSDEALLSFDINMTKLKPGVVAKLREKAANYEACMAVAQRLTALAYGMKNAPAPPDEIRTYLADFVGLVEQTTCRVCLMPLDFADFAAAVRGKAELETAHANPRLHTPNNVGFAHRACNIAQGPRTLDEFYTWIAEILHRVRGG